MCWMCRCLYGVRILSGCWVWEGARGDEDHDAARVCCFPSKVTTILWWCNNSPRSFSDSSIYACTALCMYRHHMPYACSRFIVLSTKCCWQKISYLFCRKSSGFSRGASIYRGVTRWTLLLALIFQLQSCFSFSLYWCLSLLVHAIRRHHQHGRWQARIGRVAGNKDLYLGTFSESTYPLAFASTKQCRFLSYSIDLLNMEALWIYNAKVLSNGMLLIEIQCKKPHDGHIWIKAVHGVSFLKMRQVGTISQNYFQNNTLHVGPRPSFSMICTYNPCS